MNANDSKPRHWTRLNHLVRPISIVIILSLCVSTLIAQKQRNTAQKLLNNAPRRVLMRLVIEMKVEDEEKDKELAAPFELQLRYIPPDRMQFDRNGEAFARIIGQRYYMKWADETWLRVEKETFVEMSALPPIAALTLKDSAISPEDLIKVRNLREITEAGITMIDGQSCRQYESKVTLDKESPPLHIVSTVWRTVKDKLPIKIIVRGYEGDSTDPVGTFTVMLDYKTRFTIPTPKV